MSECSMRGRDIATAVVITLVALKYILKEMDIHAAGINESTTSLLEDKVGTHTSPLAIAFTFR